MELTLGTGGRIGTGIGAAFRQGLWFKNFGYLAPSNHATIEQELIIFSFINQTGFAPPMTAAILSGRTCADPNGNDFIATAFIEAAEAASCKLEDGTERQCYRIKVDYQSDGSLTKRPTWGRPIDRSRGQTNGSRSPSAIYPMDNR